jgi:chromosome segregation protein
LFEEAAGVARYKSKKAEACRKLKNTEESLVRIQDILSEITRQLDSLEEESQRAHRFLKIEGELRRLETTYYGIRLVALKDDLSKLQEQITSSAIALSGCDTKLLNLEEEHVPHLIAKKDTAASYREVVQ